MVEYFAPDSFLKTSVVCITTIWYFVSEVFYDEAHMAPHDSVDNLTACDDKL